MMVANAKETPKKVAQSAIAIGLALSLAAPAIMAGAETTTAKWLNPSTKRKIDITHIGGKNTCRIDIDDPSSNAAQQRFASAKGSHNVTRH